MIENQQARFGLGGQFCQFECRSVEGAEILQPIRAARGVNLVVNLVEKNIASIASFDDGVGGSGVAREDNGAVGGFETIAEGLIPRAVRYKKRFHRYIRIFVDDSWRDLVDMDLIAGAIAVL